MRGQRHAPDALYPRERPGTHSTGGCVGPRAGLDRCGKPRPPPGSDPRIVQPVASRYTDYPTRHTRVYRYIEINVSEDLFASIFLDTPEGGGMYYLSSSLPFLGGILGGADNSTEQNPS